MLQRALRSGGHDAGGARGVLRDATRAAHDALHRHPVFASLLAGQLSHDGYAALLRALHSFHSGSHAVLSAAVEGLFDGGSVVAAKARIAALEGDMAALGVAPAATAALQPDRARAWNLGFAYVVHGSAIGGQVIATVLAKRSEPHFLHHDFFTAGGRHRDAWSGFCALLDRSVTGADLSGAIDGAAKGFDHFRRCLRAA